jgi:endonuclease/exonuclease/phosphatase (EEP) superfamily protein YafD
MEHWSMFWLLAALTAFLAVVTLLPIWRHEAWWVRGQDFPRLQYAVLAAALLPAQWLALDQRDASTWLLLAVTLACLAYQAWWIFPHTPLYRQEVQRALHPEPADRLRILGVNVLMPNRRADELLRIVDEAVPDVIIAVETDLWWQARLDRLEPRYPHTLKCPLDNLYGMHLYSRLPLEDGAIQYLVEPGVPSMHAMLVLRSGRRVRLHCLHPKPPSPTESADSGPRDAELVAVAKSVAESERDRPVIVAGDLNDVAWSSTTRLFRRISGLLDPRVGRGMYNTFHAHWPFLRWPLDHLFHSEHFALVHIERLRPFGSDHFPILIELALVPGVEHEQQGLSADAEDRQRADDKAAGMGVDGASVHTPQPAPSGRRV